MRPRRSSLQDELKKTRQILNEAQERATQLESRLFEEKQTHATSSHPTFFGQAQLQKLVQHDDECITLANEQGHVLYSSRPIQQLLGYPDEPCLELIPRAWLHPEDLLQAELFLQTLLSSPGIEKQIELRVRNRQGEYSWLGMKAINRLSDPLVGAIVSNVRDVTERKKAEAAQTSKMQEEHRFHCLLKALHESILELEQVNELDIFCQLCVKRGQERLGFEHLALFLYDKDRELAYGTYGTDLHDAVVSESHLYFELEKTNSVTDMLKRTMQNKEQPWCAEQLELDMNSQSAGIRWHAAAAIWDGAQFQGWLVTNDVICHSSALLSPLNMLALYSMSLGVLLGRQNRHITLCGNEERFCLLLQAVPQPIVVSDPFGQITQVNTEAEKAFGYPQNELAGQVIQVIVPDEQAGNPGKGRGQNSEIPSHLEKTVKGVYARRKDGSTFLADVHVKHVRTPDQWLVLHFVSDVTDQKLAEEVLQQTLTKEKELSELKSRFISMASHEIRTPLAVILASSESLAHYRNRLSEEQIQQRFAKIKEQVEYLTAIMNDVLLLVRMQSPQVEFNPAALDLDLFCRKVIEEFRSQPELNHPILYQCNQSNQVMLLDKKLMRQAINNLISNAIKYSAPGSLVTVSLEYRVGEAVLTVTDQGIGIPANDLSHLFEPFHRASNVENIAGTGLGLAITQEAVQLHGGQITIQSDLNVGTIVSINLPFLDKETIS